MRLITASQRRLLPEPGTWHDPLNEISEQVRRLFGLSLTTAQIEALCGTSGGWTSGSELIHTQAGKYARNLLGSRERPDSSHARHFPRAERRS